jgi:hypothetical protein
LSILKTPVVLLSGFPPEQSPLLFAGTLQMTLSNYLQHLPNEAVEEYNWEQAKTFLVGFVVGETFLLALFGVLVLYPD